MRELKLRMKLTMFLNHSKSNYDFECNLVVFWERERYFRELTMALKSLQCTRLIALLPRTDQGDTTYFRPSRSAIIFVVLAPQQRKGKCRSHLEVSSRSLEAYSS